MNEETIYKKFVKRILDIVLSLVALVVLSPLLLIAALLASVKLGSPVIFKQARPGMNEKIFYLYKFRSMTNEMDSDGRLLPDAQRLTKFGKFLRSSSLDELLELVNIIKGDMSIVGPRPLSIYYLPHYTEEFRRRHDVRPGLTGLAQVNGRNNLQWDERFSLDLQYVEHVSFLTDVKIIASTAFKVLKHSDITIRGANEVKDYGPYRVLQEESDGGVKVGNMTYSEIGSYFWLDRNEDNKGRREILWLPSVEDGTFTFSGRNAIEIAVRDILKNRSVTKAFAPSYCCVSMLQSFIDHGIKMEFYDVGFRDGEFTYQIPKTGEHDVVLIMSYFGLKRNVAHRGIAEIHGTGAVIIEDITHSLFCEDCASQDSDYLVASLRKWMEVPTGGWVGKKKGPIGIKPSLDSNHAVQEKIAAMYEKQDYLTGKISSKENFLLANAKFENDLIHVDRMLKIDDKSLCILEQEDVDGIIRKRRRNAEILLNGLKDLDGTVCDLPDIDLTVDTPLFLPIFLENEDRESLKSYLISRGIYCPIHWPEVMGAPVGVRENELSLICDQRYSEGDMQAIVDAIQEWNKNRTENMDQSDQNEQTGLSDQTDQTEKELVHQ